MISEFASFQLEEEERKSGGVVSGLWVGGIGGGV